MENLREQCQKSVDKVLEILDNNPILSPNLTQTIADSKNLLFIIDNSTPKDLIDALLKKAKDKNYKVINPYKYNASKYDFFGITKGHSPVLLDKEFLNHDTVIVVSFVTYHYLFGFTGGKNLVFPGIASEKSLNSLYKKALNINDKNINPNCKTGNVKDNPLDKEALDATMIIRQNAFYFGINLIPDLEGNIIEATCGDLFMSHLKATEVFSNLYPLKEKYTGLTLTLKGDYLQKEINIISQSLEFLEKGGRLYIDGSSLKTFGSNDFIGAFYKNTVADIIEGLIDSFSIDVFEAMILKDICSKYHICIFSPLEENIIRQAGLNPIKASEKEDFLKDCNNVREVFNAIRFPNIREENISS